MSTPLVLKRFAATANSPVSTAPPKLSVLPVQLDCLWSVAAVVAMPSAVTVRLALPTASFALRPFLALSGNAPAAMPLTTSTGPIPAQPVRVAVSNALVLPNVPAVSPL